MTLVDGNNLAFRSFFAFRQLSFEGDHTGVYYGFMSAHARLKAKYGDAFVYCFDSPTSWRKGVYAGYKAKRSKEDDDPEKANVRTTHIPELMRVLSVLGYPVLQYPLLEADDLLALTAHRLKRKNISKLHIYSGDRDLYQLLDTAIVLRPTPFGGGVKRYTANMLQEEYGVRPERWAQALALGVDKSDGIKAIPRCGPTTAFKMLELGADPARPWDSQPDSFRTRFPKVEDYWPAAQLAYKLTKLPEVTRSVPIPNTGELFDFLRSMPLRRNPDPNMRTLFLDFCARHGLAEFRKDRSKFLS